MNAPWPSKRILPQSSLTLILVVASEMSIHASVKKKKLECPRRPQTEVLIKWWADLSPSQADGGSATL